MARKSRKCYESGYFHIMVQGIEKKYIFETELLKKAYIKYVIKAAKCNNVKIIAYCIMDNHAHYLIYTENNENMTKMMSSANTRFAKLYNNCKQRCGYVFRDRYRCENIYTEEYLKHCIMYIYNNPVKAGICTEATKYPYSNCVENLADYNYTEEYYENFIEIDNEFGEDLKFDNPRDVVKRWNNIPNGIEKKFSLLVKDLEKNCGMTKTKIAEYLKISRKTLYRMLEKEK